jgi:hypothetical protein
MDLDTRLGMLVSSNTISKNVASLVRKIIYRLDNNWKISLSDKNGVYIVTNLAMTLMPQGRFGMYGFPDCASIDTARKSDIFPRAIEITEDCMHYAGVNISEDEKEFLQTNLCCVLENA